ncbi:hypothetical protein DPPLL_32560 [Desulfofustis limnaeus]|uniref:Uncharacterized protein n=1 Tax=Desulfofustis limnaeus TaxID=2740163 RepID=A0ABN6M7R1_9BACT|nr:hypothetical protein DPPLL_32560 [Desulfofustis limnaeus]
MLAQLARDRGKKLEPGLFELWGGVPSERLLRHSDPMINPIEKRKYHAMLASRSGVQGPSEAEEVSEPEVAKSIYKLWSNYLRSVARDSKRFNLLFEENINYGFRRNLLGLRPFCILSGLIGVVGCGWDVYGNYRIGGSIDSVDKILIFSAEIIYIGVVLFVIKQNWVRVPAEAYAMRLIETLDG